MRRADQPVKWQTQIKFGLYSVLAVFIGYIAKDIIHEYGNQDLTSSEKVALLERFYDDDFVVSDTIISYDLYTDSLVLTFEQKANFDKWNMNLSLVDTSSSDEVVLGMNIVRPVIDNQIVIKGFHLGEDSLDTYAPFLTAGPHFDNSERIIWNPKTKHNKIGFRADREKQRLTPIKRLTWRFISFNTKMLTTVSDKESEYLIDFLERKMHWK